MNLIEEQQAALTTDYAKLLQKIHTIDNAAGYGECVSINYYGIYLEDLS